MAKKSTRRKKLTKKLLHKYRLVILNEDTFEERFAIKLTRLNVFVLMSLSAVILVLATTLIIAFTPLREYIPGYSSTALKRQAAQLSYKTDSLQQAMTVNARYLESIKLVLKGDVSTVNFNKDSIIEAAQMDIDEISLIPSRAVSYTHLTLPTTSRV